MPSTELELKVVQSGRNGQLSIRNAGRVPAFNVIIDNFPDGYSDFLDDNSFCLWPAEERMIAFELGTDSSVRNVIVRAWNAPALSID